MGRDRLSKLGEWLIRYRFGVLAAWCVLIVIGCFLAPRVDNILQGGTQIPGYQSEAVKEILKDKFGNRFGHEMVLVFYGHGHKMDEPLFQKAVEDIQLGLRESSKVENMITYYDTQSSELVSKDEHCVLGLVELDVPDSFGAQKATGEVREIIRGKAVPDWFEVYVTGQGATYYDIIHSSTRDALWAEARSFPLVIVILVFTFGALFASGIPVILGLASVMVALGLVYFTGLRWPMFVLAKNAVTMIGLGVGIDYSLFMVSRFREELENGSLPRQAVVAIMPTSGKTVIFSGATVIIGLISVFIPNLPFLNSMALAAITVVAVSVAGAITLLPILFYWIGPAINWPRSLTRLISRSKNGRFWHRLATQVMKRPVLFFVFTLVILLAIAYPARNIKTYTLTAAGLPRGVESRLGYERLQTDFVAGKIAPIEIIIEAPDPQSLWSPDSVARIYRLSRAIAADPRVFKVDGIVDIDPQMTLADYQKLYCGPEGMAGSQSIFAQMVNAYIADNGRGRQILMRVTAVGEPGSAESRAIVKKIRNQWGTRIFGGSPFRIRVGGSSALQVDLDHLLMGKLPTIIGIVCVVTFLILIVLFRSLLIPLKSILMNVLSVLASFGFLAGVFQNPALAARLGHPAMGGISSIILVMLFAVLFGLSMDYEIFLTLRIKEEHDRGRTNEESVAWGLEKTGGLVTSAALIMVAVFGAFAFTSMMMTQEFGLGLATAVFLDATVIRVLLMPAAMRLLGEWNWWLPRGLAKILPRIHDI